MLIVAGALECIFCLGEIQWFTTILSNCSLCFAPSIRPDIDYQIKVYEKYEIIIGMKNCSTGGGI